MFTGLGQRATRPGILLLGCVALAAVQVAPLHAQPVTNGLRFVLQADGLTGYANGDPVAVWPDLSGQSLDVSQSNAARRPAYIAAALNGLPVVRFDGGDWLKRDSVTGSLLMSTNEATAYVVVKQLGSDPYNTTLFWGTPTNRLLIHTTWGDWLSFQHGNAEPGGGGGAVWLQPAGWDDQWHVVEFVRNGPNWDCAVGGAGQGRVNTPDTPEINEIHTLWVCSDLWGNTQSGDLAELLIYDRALTRDERGQVAAYLGNKYALPIEPIVLADLNCDGVVNFDDISPFVLALSNVAGYYEALPGCNLLNGDVDCDGAVTFDDINGFVACLSGDCHCP